jgi:predicted nucleic acid-binding protein
VILPDTNILGTCARVGALDLLLALFAEEDICIVPAVYAELIVGMREGRQFLQRAIELVENGKLILFTLTTDEVVQRLRLPASLNEGEAECIAVCNSRAAAFVTNDKRARNFARSLGIEVFDLIEVLRSFWRLGVCSKRRVRQLVADIETKEGMVIKHKEQIFAK